MFFRGRCLSFPIPDGAEREGFDIIPEAKVCGLLNPGHDGAKLFPSSRGEDGTGFSLGGSKPCAAQCILGVSG